MNAVAQPRPSAMSVTHDRPEQGLAAQDLALGYLRSISACWRGDAGASVFTTRLGAYACSDLPPAPHTPPDAMSPHGGGGRGIHWYHIGNDVLGDRLGKHQLLGLSQQIARERARLSQGEPRSVMAG